MSSWKLHLSAILALAVVGLPPPRIAFAGEPPSPPGVEGAVPADGDHCPRADLPGWGTPALGEHLFDDDPASVVKGDQLERVERTVDSLGLPALAFELTSAGAKKLAELTGNNIGRQLSITLDGKALSVPTILSKIGPIGMLTGRFLATEIDDLVSLLRHDKLPAPLVLITDERR
ncbi:MAG: hypothetical protein ACE5GW_08700 [Planctomycetota bacterium]